MFHGQARDGSKRHQTWIDRIEEGGSSFGRRQHDWGRHARWHAFQRWRIWPATSMTTSVPANAMHSNTTVQA
jgi:hypothetical protein